MAARNAEMIFDRLASRLYFASASATASDAILFLSLESFTRIVRYFTHSSSVAARKPFSPCLMTSVLDAIGVPTGTIPRAM